MIIAFHLLNDWSGSPRVLACVAKGMLADGRDFELVTSRGGVLDSFAGHARFIRYRYSRNRLLRGLRFAGAQLQLFAQALRLRRGDTAYINTILPVGAALGARLRGAKVIYHCHEDAKARGRLYQLLQRAMLRLADGIICVSQYQRDRIVATGQRPWIKVVPNGVADSLANRLTPHIDKAFEQRNILMVTALRDYKGVRHFARLAAMLPEFRFTLATSDTADSPIYQELTALEISNLKIVTQITDPAEYYNYASLIINLTGGATNRKGESARETFGMTIAEGAFAALPAIVPREGGIAERVQEGVNGYHLNRDELEQIAERIRKIFSDKRLYTSLSEGALASSASYAESAMTGSILAAIDGALPG